MYLSKNDIERIAQTTLNTYRSRVIGNFVGVDYIDPVEIAEKALGLKIEYVRFAEKNIYAATSRVPTRIKTLTYKGEPETKTLEPDMIFVNSELLLEKYKSRHNFVVAHELAHQILFRLYPNKKEIYSVDVGIAYKKERPERDKQYWDEWQADNLAAAILMPRFLVEKHLENVGWDSKPRLTKAQANYLKDKMLVTPKQIEIRLNNLGLIKSQDIIIDIYKEEGAYA